MSAARPPRFVCLHGHFYQPPRENPWLEVIEAQPSAAPFHDWNERIAAECYGPNTVARVLAVDGQIADLRNNYESISFNFGPTLLSWMERSRPDMYAAILAADRASAARLGHGNAMAQAYGHAILPLAAAHDQLTQVRWGVADFVHRFGRRPEGMWLPETAVDLATLRVLADEGIRFTLLAPGQAARVRRRGSAWHAVEPHSLDTGRPYRCDLGEGRSIVLFFYDGPLSHAVAFAGLLNDGRALASRLASLARERPPQGLVHVATDGESYGHHHRFGEMALAAALADLEREPGIELTNYAAYLAQVEVEDEVQIREATSWSCAHGVERWRSDCGCRVGDPGWQQAWRTPLREALDWLKAQLDVIFEREGSRFLPDPWAARDAYVGVLLGRDRDQRNAFLHQQARAGLHAHDRTRVWQLLEMQRHGLLSFTSCGWFFDDPTGLETRQILTYAARALQLAELQGESLTPGFLRRLAPMRSNLPSRVDGTTLFRDEILPQVTDPRRVVAHWALHGAFEEPEPDSVTYAWRVLSRSRHVEAGGVARLTVGRVGLVEEGTEDRHDFEYATLHLGGHDLVGAVIPAGPEAAAAERADRLVRIFRGGPMSDVLRDLRGLFDDGLYTLRDVFRAERQRLLARITGAAREEAARLGEQLVERHHRLVEFLLQAEEAVPAELRAAANLVWQRRFDRAVARLAQQPSEPEAALKVSEDAERWGVLLDRAESARWLERLLGLEVERLAREGDESRVEALLKAVEELRLPVEPTAAQNALFGLWRGASPAWRRRHGGRLEPIARRLRIVWPPGKP